MTSVTYDNITLTKAEKLVEFLDANYDEGRRFFRGVSDSDKHDLVPSALRTARATTNGEQVEQEARDALRFYDAAYLLGLPIPRWPDVSDAMERYRKNGIHFPWPPENMDEFLALAQHNGVATRLLDWTRDPMVAAYFAAWELKGGGKSVAVWVLDPSVYASENEFALSGIKMPITVPYDVNRNAHAQRGVFTLQQRIQMPCRDDPPDREPLDVRMAHGCKNPKDVFKKVTLPRDQTAQLLKLLDRRRINRATMFPGYRGAALAAQEREFWSR